MSVLARWLSGAEVAAATVPLVAMIPSTASGLLLAFDES
jgi:hypothetical protein